MYHYCHRIKLVEQNIISGHLVFKNCKMDMLHIYIYVIYQSIAQHEGCSVELRTVSGISFSTIRLAGTKTEFTEYFKKVLLLVLV